MIKGPWFSRGKKRFCPILVLVNDMRFNQNVEHDIITRDAYSVSGAEIWEFSKSQRDIIDAVTI